MSGEDPGPEEASSPAGQRPSDHRFSEEARDYLRLRNTAAGLRQDFNMMEQKKRVTMVLQSPSFREELESLIQEQTKKGRSSHIWALRQIADFMATSAPAVFPTTPIGPSTVAPINDLQGSDTPPLAKGERQLRCKLAALHRLLDLHGWAALGHAYVTVRVSKEQGHFLVRPPGLHCAGVTAATLVKVNIVGEVVEGGSSGGSGSAPVDSVDFRLHAAIYAARPDVRCVVHLHTPATAAVSAMKCGLLAASHDALLVGDTVYYDFNGEMEDEADRVNLQKCLGPTCKMMVLRNHGMLALGATVEEAFYNIFHAQAACETQVAALPSAGGAENLIVLERERYRTQQAGAGRWAGTTFGPMQKSRLGEHEFEALMRMLDNLGFRTGYSYRYPFVQDKARPRGDVEIPAAVTAFIFEDEEGAPGGGGGPLLPPHAHKQQKEKTRWLNTPNTYLRVDRQAEAQRGLGSPRATTAWMKAEEADRAGSGTPIRIENPNQFVPLYTDPQEVLQMRNKIREQNRQEVKSAGPQSQLLAGVISDESRSPSVEGQLASRGEEESKEVRRRRREEEEEEEEEEEAAEAEPPNPFSQLTDQELEEYRREVESKKLDRGHGEKETPTEEPPPAEKSGSASPAQSPSRQPEVQSPSRQPEAQSPSRQPEVQSPSQQPGVQSPSRQPGVQSPSRQPGVQSPSRQPEVQSPSRQSEVQSPSRQSEVQSPSRQSEVQSPSRQSEVQSPSRQTEVQSPSESPSKMASDAAEESDSGPRPAGTVVNGKEDEPPAGGESRPKVPGEPRSQDGSPSKSPSKKKKKFRTPSFLKKSKKKEKVDS
ncbi:beta-adducin [Tachyglossus aculeatus]|uniref:beta-adducin n=1 Tax=Tachyglossus aculeatus TaxID=9261 RepID=UPI0018F2F102|nr:beta-adducin [Tachyglossus aculeatus]